MQTNEEYLDSLLASVSGQSGQEQSQVEDTIISDHTDKHEEREVISDDVVELSEEDLMALQAMIDDVEDYSLEDTSAETKEKSDGAEEVNEETSTPLYDDKETDKSISDVDEETNNLLSDVEEETNNLLSDEDTSNSLVGGNDEDSFLTDETDNNIPLAEVIEKGAIEEAIEETDDSMDEIMQMLGMNQTPEEQELDQENIEALIQQATLKGKSEGEQAKESLDDKDLSDLLGTLGNSDDELAEIGDILQKSDNNEAIDEELLSILSKSSEGEEPQGMFDNEKIDSDEIIPLKEDIKEEPIEENKKKKEKKKWGKKKDKPVKELTEEEEMAQLLEEAEPEKKTKKTKKKKGKKGSGSAKDTNASLEEELDDEDKTAEIKLQKERAKKEKAAQKEAKRLAAKQKRDEKYAYLDQGRKISTRGIVAVMAICFSLATVMMVTLFFIPDVLNKKKAREEFYLQDYETVVSRLYGKKLNESDKLMYEKSVLFYHIQEQKDAYPVYLRMQDSKKALDTLLQAAKSCESSQEKAQEFGMSEELQVFRRDIFLQLHDDYDLDEETVLAIIQMEALEYTYAVEHIITGEPITKEETKIIENKSVETDTNGNNDELDDLLPEEMELMNPVSEEEMRVLMSGRVINGEVNLAE